jgi:hypothetical protein
MADTSILTKRKISHDEAREALRRFENHFWKKKADGPRIGIPARPDYDDDLVLLAYIDQQAARDDEQKGNRDG